MMQRLFHGLNAHTLGNYKSRLKRHKYSFAHTFLRAINNSQLGCFLRIIYSSLALEMIIFEDELFIENISIIQHTESCVAK